MAKYLYIFVLAFLFTISSQLYSQISYQGPVTFTVDTGAIVNTGTFLDAPVSNDIEPIVRGENTDGLSGEPYTYSSDNADVLPVTYVEDNVASDSPNLVGDNSMLLNQWNVQLDNNVIPPDPTCAVGPNHIILLTNNGNGIRIYDKQGTLLKTLSSDQWWSAVWPSQSGDPQIIYDHYEGRWVMVCMQTDDIALTAGDLIAYSDDSDPFGTWYMYRLPSNLWGDYPQIGFDEEAIYIATNNFPLAGGSGLYAKIRIIVKDELYTSNAGPLSYKDIWNISLPNSGSVAWNLRPSYQYSPSDGHYLVYASRTGGNFYAIYKLINPTTTPSMTAVKIIVPFYGEAPSANQLGGGTPLVESGGSPIRTAPIFRDGYLYGTHSIRNTVYPSNSSVKYFKVDVSSNTVVESAELGAQNYYYLYPTLTVDKDGNVFVTYSRSATTEYIGAFYSTRRFNDPSGLSPSKPLQVGLGNYIKTFGGDRNRWGDYMGIFLDPDDELSAWMFTEYASTGNNYATAVGQVRLKPFDSIYVFPENRSFDFGEIQIGSPSDTVDVVFSNFGIEDLIISNIPDLVGDFRLLTPLVYPYTVSTYDSVYLKFLFIPDSIGAQSIEYPISTNFPDLSHFNFSGKGYQIQAVQTNTLYAVSGTQNAGSTLTINKINGQGTNIGPSNYNDLISLAIHPDTKIMYSVRSSALGSTIMKVNGLGGDAYPFLNYNLPEIFSIAFDTLGNLYAALRNGKIYKLNIENGSDSLISTMPCERVSIKFRPTDNQLWGIVKNFLGNPKDQVIKIDLETGDTTRVGRTGYAVNTLDLVFDENDQLYGIKGSGTAISDLFKINQTTGAGSLVGSVGIKDLTGLAYFIEFIPSDIEEQSHYPMDYNLSQNFPNPFNPSTQIRFALPVSANVKITIYNLLGEVVKQLTSKDMNPGNHTVHWNADDISGNKVSSGIYFYELSANGVDGSRFNQVRKMMLLK